MRAPGKNCAATSAVKGADGQWHLKADPYAFASELRPNTASLLYDLGGYAWNDQEWMERRKTWHPYSASPSTSMRCTWAPGGGENGRMLSYTEIADQLIPYIEEMGYTHVDAAGDGASWTCPGAIR